MNGIPMIPSTRTIIKSNGFIIVTAVIISVLIFLFGKTNKEHSENQHKLSFKIFLKQSGWGYDIFADDKLFIHQELVPVLPTQKGFSKKEYAEKAALMVIHKLEQNHLPTLAKDELSHICSLDSLTYEPPKDR